MLTSEITFGMLTNMKRVSLIMLICISALLFSPLAIAPSHAKAGSGPSLVTLDVCTASGVFLSGDGDTTSLHECFVSPAPGESRTSLEMIQPLFAACHFSLQLERPPQA